MNFQLLSRLYQLQDQVMKLQSRLTSEIGTREADETVLNNRVTDLATDVDELEKRMSTQLKSCEVKAREGAGWSDTEKKRIVMQVRYN